MLNSPPDRFDTLMIPKLRLFCLGLVVCAHGLPAYGAAPTTVEATAQKLDGIIESLKKEAVDFNREAQDVEQAIVYPEHTRVAVYISCNVSQLLLQNVTVTVDDGKPVRYDYSERTAKALLLSDGLHRIVLTNLEPGAHKIVAEFRGQFADADAGDAPVTGRFEETFEKARKPMDLELRVARYTRISKPKMSLVVWKKAGDPVAAQPPPERSSKANKRRTPK